MCVPSLSFLSFLPFSLLIAEPLPFTLTGNVDLSITRDPLSDTPNAQRSARRSFDLLRSMQIDIGSTVKLPSGLSEAQMQQIFDDRWYSEVMDPTSGFSHLAVREIRTNEEQTVDVEESEGEGVAAESWSIDPASAASASEVERVMNGKVGKVQTVAATPPRLMFGKLQKDVLEIRELARAGKAREEKLRKSLKGKEVHHWVQGPLFADLEEEEEVEEAVVEKEAAEVVVEEVEEEEKEGVVEDEEVLVEEEKVEVAEEEKVEEEAKEVVVEEEKEKEEQTK